MNDSRYRHKLPQLDGSFFLTDGGLETTLIFHDGLDLPQFAAFDLLKDDEGTEALRRYFRRYAKLAADNGTGFVLESPDLARQPALGEGDRLLRRGARAAEPQGDRPDGGDPRGVRDRRPPFVISGNIGPQDDGYNPQTLLSADEARGVPLDPDQHLRRHRRRHGHGDDDDLRRRGDRRRARGEARRDAVGDLVHGRDRRQAPERPGARRRDRRGRGGDGRRAPPTT